MVYAICLRHSYESDPFQACLPLILSAPSGTAVISVHRTHWLELNSKCLERYGIID